MPPRFEISGTKKLAMEPGAAQRKYGGVMPINELVKQHAFTPDDIKLLVTAYEEALQELQLRDRSDPPPRCWAKRIVELAQQGERDPIRLREAAVNGS